MYLYKREISIKLIGSDSLFKFPSLELFLRGLVCYSRQEKLITLLTKEYILSLELCIKIILSEILGRIKEKKYLIVNESIVKNAEQINT